jgi:hypothetical protein
MRALLLIVVAGLALSCSKKEETKPLPAIDSEWSDRFERDDVGPDYNNTGGSAFTLTNGSLRAMGAHNRPLWLRRRLPDNVVIELDAWSQSPAGDIKVEIFGDGKSYDPNQGSYMSTGYVLVFGGWNNTKSIIARKDEHGKDLVERSDRKVELGKRYHWKIERKSGAITWYVDDMSTPFLQYTDPSPLKGAGHGFLAFGNWEADNGFDNLVIKPL